MDLFPKNPNFFALFEELAKTVKIGGEILTEIRTLQKISETYSKRARQLEKQADEVCHKLYHETNSTFITPIDREDIYLLARSLDNIIDLIEDLVSKLTFYNVNGEMPGFRKFCQKVREVANKLFLLTCLLKGRGRQIDKMRQLIIKIHSLENQGDALIRKAYKFLFANHKEAIVLMKWKDIFDNLEEILDEAENTVDIVDEIIVKNF